MVAIMAAGSASGGDAQLENKDKDARRGGGRDEDEKLWLPGLGMDCIGDEAGRGQRPWLASRVVGRG